LRYASANNLAEAFMIDRRTMMMAALAAAPGMIASRGALAQAGMSRITAYAFSFPGLAGGDIRLAEFAGRPMLIVNTASLCGFTPQYGGLQELWSEFKGRGLMIIGIPSNDFGGQEPGAAGDIMKTASGEYGVTFPIAAKVVVKGPGQHPFYKWAAAERPLETPRWNFHKYLIGRDGHIAAVFATDIEPMDARVIDAVVKQLPRAE
jgi:glutathione peroxidase